MIPLLLAACAGPPPCGGTDRVDICIGAESFSIETWSGRYDPPDGRFQADAEAWALLDPQAHPEGVVLHVDAAVPTAHVHHVLGRLYASGLTAFSLSGADGETLGPFVLSHEDPQLVPDEGASVVGVGALVRVFVLSDQKGTWAVSNASFVPLWSATRSPAVAVHPYEVGPGDPAALLEALPRSGPALARQEARCDEIWRDPERASECHEAYSPPVAPCDLDGIAPWSAELTAEAKRRCERDLALRGPAPQPVEPPSGCFVPRSAGPEGLSTALRAGIERLLPDETVGFSLYVDVEAPVSLLFAALHAFSDAGAPYPTLVIDPTPLQNKPLCDPEAFPDRRALDSSRARWIGSEIKLAEWRVMSP